MRVLIALFAFFFGVLSFGRGNLISKSNLEKLKKVQVFDSTLQQKINEEDLIGDWFTRTITHSKYRSNPYPRFRDIYSFKKDFSIKYKRTSGTWSLSANNILTITTISRKEVYRLRYLKDGVLILNSPNSTITLKKFD